jgi:hypothetical protein
MFQPPVGSVTRSNSRCALPHLAAPQGVTTCSCLRPVPVSASLCPGTADGAVGLARWLLPCLPSHGGFQLHSGWHRRPPRWFAPIRLGTPASDWRLGTSRGCSAHIALAPGKRPPALDAPTQGLASILMVRCSVTAPPWGCAVLPVGGYLQQALRVQAGHARAWWSWRGLAAYPGGSAPPDPCQPKRIVGRLVFYCWAVCRAGTGSGRVLPPLSARPDAGVNAAVDGPWQR